MSVQDVKQIWLDVSCGLERECVSASLKSSSLLNEEPFRGCPLVALSPAAPTQPGAEQKQATPSISLPKGGGAIRGIGEKFAANPVTGTGSMSVPLATSPGRSGFGPQLSLSYDSGSSNGPFGFGWSLSLPAIPPRTPQRLPAHL